MKKVMIFLIILTILVSACSNDDGSDDTKRSPVQPQEDKKVDGPKTYPTPDIKDITFTAIDGTNLAGTYYLGNTEKGVILYHTLSKDRSDWEPFANKLYLNGMTVLNMDLRGHGKSDLDYDDFTDDDWIKLVSDVDSAVKYMRRTNRDVKQITLVGASIGANAVLIDAAKDQGITKVALFSPGENYHGLMPDKSINEYGNRKLFITCARGDLGSSAFCNKLNSRATGPRLSKIYEGSTHGIALFDANPGLDDVFIKWAVEE